MIVFGILLEKKNTTSNSKGGRAEIGNFIFYQQANACPSGDAGWGVFLFLKPP